MVHQKTYEFIRVAFTSERVEMVFTRIISAVWIVNLSNT